jgi:hypothetical protein
MDLPPTSADAIQLASSSEVTDLAPGMIPVVPCTVSPGDADSETVKMVPISARVRGSQRQTQGGRTDPTASNCCLLL